MSKAYELYNKGKDHTEFSIKAISKIRILGSIISTGIVSKIIWAFINSFTISSQASWELVQLIVTIYFFSWFLAALKGIEVQALVLNSISGISNRSLPEYLALLIGFPIGAASMLMVLFGEIVVPYIAFFWNRSITQLLNYLSYFC